MESFNAVGFLSIDSQRIQRQIFCLVKATSQDRFGMVRGWGQHREVPLLREVDPTSPPVLRVSAEDSAIFSLCPDNSSAAQSQPVLYSALVEVKTP